MKIFGIEHKYREFGLSYGLPVWHIIHGFTTTIDPINIVDTMVKMGLQPGSWVCLTDGMMREQGFGTLLRALKSVRSRIEVEDDGSSKTPGEAFNLVDRYIIEWRESPMYAFNIGALRPMQDILVYRGEDIPKFIEATKDSGTVRVIEHPDPKAIWGTVKNTNIRVYKRVS